MTRIGAAVLIILTLAVAAVAQPAAPPSAGEIDKAVVLVSVLFDSGGRTVRTSGSGIILDAEGLVLTAAHVVARAQAVEVTLWTGQTLAARLIGMDSLFDLALLRVDPQGPLPTAVLGSAARLEPGAPLTALGRAPRRQSGPTTGALIDLDVDARPGVPHLRASTLVWPGDSGGAMIDGRGEVVGLIVAASRNGEMSLSVAIDAVKRLLPGVMAGAVRHAWIGISGRTLTPELAEEMGLSGRRGVVVLEVIPGGPAAAAGLRGSGPAPAGEIPRGGDLIVAIDHQPVTTFGAMAAYILSRGIGDTVTLQIVRGNDTYAIPVVLGERPNV